MTSVTTRSSAPWIVVTQGAVCIFPMTWPARTWRGVSGFSARPPLVCQKIAKGGETCDSPDLCVEIALCDAEGECVPEVKVQCKSSACMASECDSLTGECTYTLLNGDKCDDNNPCTNGRLV